MRLLERGDAIALEAFLARTVELARQIDRNAVGGRQRRATDGKRLPSHQPLEYGSGPRRVCGADRERASQRGFEQQFEARAYVGERGPRRTRLRRAIAPPQIHRVRSRVPCGIDDDVFGFRHR
jgi:hypothetical protein